MDRLKAGFRWTGLSDGETAAPNYIELNREVGLLPTAEQGGRVITNRFVHRAEQGGRFS